MCLGACSVLWLYQGRKFLEPECHFLVVRLFSCNLPTGLYTLLSLPREVGTQLGSPDEYVVVPVRTKGPSVRQIHVSVKPKGRSIVHPSKKVGNSTQLPLLLTGQSPKPETVESVYYWIKTKEYRFHLGFREPF